MALGSFALTVWFVGHHASPTTSLAELAMMALLTLWPASEAVIAVINRSSVESAVPRRMPRLALGDGIPAEHRVLVVIPAMLIEHR